MDNTLSELEPFGPDLWRSTDPKRILGMKLSATMTVVRLPDSGLLLYSPVAMTTQRREAVDALGTVTHLYAPNTFHHGWIGEWATAYPGAYVHAPAALVSKRRDLRIDRRHDEDALDTLAGVFDEVHIDGFMLEETVLVHRPSGTLLVADLVFNVGRPEHWWTKAYTRAMGFYDRVAQSRIIKWTAFNDTERARMSLERLDACSFDRLIVGHGDPIEEGAHAAIMHAYDWLQRQPRLLPGPRGAAFGRCG